MMVLPAVPSQTTVSFMRIFSVITVLLSAAANGDESTLTYSGLSNPFHLFPGEVGKRNEIARLPEYPIAISRMYSDIVEKDPLTGELVEVPLSEAYNHHLIFTTSYKREPLYQQRTYANRQLMANKYTKELPFPYAYVFDKPILMMQAHIINTRTMSHNEAFQCLECPCWGLGLSDEEFLTRLEAHFTVLRKRCSPQLVKENNTACFPETYTGGIACCEPGDFCLEDYYMSKDAISHSTDNSTQSVFYGRWNIEYTPVTPEIIPVYWTTIYDGTGENFEYDIPKCPDNDDVCVHEMEYIDQLHRIPNSEGEGYYVDVVQLRTHIHKFGISITAYIESTGEVLCESLAGYGTGEPGEVGNEQGYMVSMSECTFDPPRRMKTTEIIRTVTKYNATEAHTGAMSLLEVLVADVPGHEGGFAANNVGTLDETIEDNDGSGQEGGGAVSDVATLDETIEDEGGSGQEGGTASAAAATFDETIEDNGGSGQEGGTASVPATLDETIEDDGGSAQEGGTASVAATPVEDEGGFWNHLMVVAAVITTVIFVTWHAVIKMGLVSGHQKFGSDYSSLRQSDVENI